MLCIEYLDEAEAAMHIYADYRHDLYPPFQETLEDKFRSMTGKLWSWKAGYENQELCDQTRWLLHRMAHFLKLKVPLYP
jgi:hypothetical protein